MDRKAPFLTVSQLNGYVKALIDGVDGFRGLTIKGEISNFKRYPNAAYFDLKDERSVLSCLMWSDSLFYLPFEPKDGDEVLATGNLQVYQPKGRYQLYVRGIELYGQGAELLRLEALRKKLSAEGLFAESRKRPLPLFPKAIGLIVGAGSAAEADLIKNIQRRWPLADILVFPSLVQGASAPKDLLRAYDLSATRNLSTLIFARGGGSNEDLSAFNDEALVRAVAKSPVPTISAVGHEVDFTLLDYVVDKRVSTPTAAAEAATPDEGEIRQRIDEASSSLLTDMARIVSKKRNEVASLSERPFFKNPRSMYKEAKGEVLELGRRLAMALSGAFALQKSSLRRYDERLDALNPYRVLERGYSITENGEGLIVKSVKDVKKGDTLKTRLKDGIIVSKVQ
ncbi:MAG: exodeoxyribonuclease VII large subunit [Bacilli bacterium]|nr:exodeoxyribonuclease VII large subunit [Bacilli bacterium]